MPNSLGYLLRRTYFLCSSTITSPRGIVTTRALPDHDDFELYTTRAARIMVFNAAKRARAREAERRWLPKLVLRVLCILFVIVSIGLAGRTYGYDYGVIWLSVPLCLSFAWNVANIIVRMVRARPMHPGANVGCDLVLCLLFAVALALSFLSAIPTSKYDPYFYNGYKLVPGTNETIIDYNSRQCSGFENCSDLDNYAGLVRRTVRLLLHFEAPHVNN